MLLNFIKIGSEAVVWKSGAAKRSLAAIACISVLSGCESLPEMPTYDDMKAGLSETYDKTVSSIDEAWNSDAAPAEGAASNNEVPVALDHAAVKRLQNRLAGLGYRSGRADGIMGSKTTRAIRRYQSAHSLPVTGKVSLQFLEHIEANSANGDSKDMLTTAPY